MRLPTLCRTCLLPLLAVAACSGTDHREPERRIPVNANPVVVITTSKGTIKAELWADRAPGTVKNFLAYVDEGFFDGLIFHRVIPGFMIQGGGFSPTMKQKATKANIRNEAGPFGRNERGTLAMARTPDPHSASSQFFINLVYNDFLDFREPTSQGFGYCVFGKVFEGMEVVDAIAAVPRGNHGPHGDVPTTPVVITSIRRAE
ncbi:MAG: peptidylprolyl isomerase [Deltaproteobacteria bacterium]|nr:peptidylprolyl isomerase [Deltaproteobacteria bacterium]